MPLIINELKPYKVVEVEYWRETFKEACFEMHTFTMFKNKQMQSLYGSLIPMMHCYGMCFDVNDNWHG